MQPIMAAGGDSDYLFLDCAGINTADMLLGMPGWYRGAGKRPKLAELLWNRRGKRCVVVLDEFEKMAPGAQEDLLRVFDDGECKSCFMSGWLVWVLRIVQVCTAAPLTIRQP